jgi:hypothetical protein
VRKNFISQDSKTPLSAGMKMSEGTAASDLHPIEIIRPGIFNDLDSRVGELSEIFSGGFSAFWSGVATMNHNHFVGKGKCRADGALPGNVIQMRQFVND